MIINNTPIINTIISCIYRIETAQTSAITGNFLPPTKTTRTTATVLLQSVQQKGSQKIHQQLQHQSKQQQIQAQRSQQQQQHHQQQQVQQQKFLLQQHQQSQEKQRLLLQQQYQQQQQQQLQQQKKLLRQQSQHYQQQQFFLFPQPLQTPQSTQQSLSTHQSQRPISDKYKSVAAQLNAKYEEIRGRTDSNNDIYDRIDLLVLESNERNNQYIEEVHEMDIDQFSSEEEKLEIIREFRYVCVQKYI